MPTKSGQYILAEPVAQNRLLRMHVFAMRVFGYAIFEHQCAQWAHNWRGIALSLLFTAFNVTQYVDLANSFGDFDEMTTNASTTLLFTTTVLRMYLFYRHREEWIEVVRTVHEDTTLTWTSGTASDKSITNQHVRYTNRLTIVFWTMAMVTSNLMLVTSFVQVCLYSQSGETEPPLILRSWFPFDVHGRLVFAGYFVQFSAMWMGMIVVPSWNSLMVVLMTNAIISLEQLNVQLQHPLKRSTEANLYANLVECVRKLQRTRTFVAKLERLMSPFIFLDFMVFSILLCALLFQASQAEFGVQLAINVCYIFTMISILWMYYWHANEIILWSNRLSGSMYECDWYGGDKRKFTNALHIFMACTQHPIMMRTVFLEMNLVNFINILRASYSYFTLLQQLDA